MRGATAGVIAAASWALAEPPPGRLVGTPLSDVRRLGGLVTLAAELENLFLWPGGRVLDRIHPDRREGRRPKLATNGPVVAYELATHAVFGAALGGRVRG